jgi:hypothetical protein
MQATYFRPLNNTFTVADLTLNMMACCHGLTVVAGNLIGDPLDEKLFQATKYAIQPTEEEGYVCKLYFTLRRGASIPGLFQDLHSAQIRVFK